MRPEETQGLTLFVEQRREGHRRLGLPELMQPQIKQLLSQRHLLIALMLFCSPAALQFEPAEQGHQSEGQPHQPALAAEWRQGAALLLPPGVEAAPCVCGSPRPIGHTQVSILIL